ncbi:MAG: hypothetical protein ACOYO1_09975 [Bacteroidales bacterium]
MQFVKYFLLPLTVIAGWTIYFIGYHFGNEKVSCISSIITDGLRAIFSAGRLFVLGNDLIEVPESIKENPAFLLWFSFIGSSAVFISTSILLNLFGKRMITKIEIWLNSSKENHIFLGVNDASLSLAIDIIRKNKKSQVIFIKRIDKDEDASLYLQLEESGALIINRESIIDSLKLESEEGIFHTHKVYSDHKNLNKLGLIKKVYKSSSHLYFLTSKEEWNMNMARSVLNEIDTSALKHKLVMHIRTNSPELEEAFYESLKNVSKNIQFNLLNHSEIAARQLVIKHKPIDWIEKDTNKAIAISDFNVMIIGFDQTGNAVLRKLIEYGHFEGSKFKAVVIDKSVQAKKGRFANSFPGIISNYSIDFYETEAGSSVFFDLIRQHMDTMDYIVINLGDDALNITTALDIQQYILKNSIRKIKIIAQVKNNESYKQLFTSSLSVNIFIFGRTMDMFTEAIVVRGHFEAMAKKIHEYYNLKKPLNKRRFWEDLSKTEQSTNISEAEHIYVKISMAGLKTDDIKQIENVSEFENYLGPEKMKNLAKGEHISWNSVLYTNGWSQWKLKEIPDESNIQKDEIRKLHACLVNWEDLKLVGERFGENYYQYDYESITDIYKLIKEGIYTKNI